MGSVDMQQLAMMEHQTQPQFMSQKINTVNQVNQAQSPNPHAKPVKGASPITKTTKRPSYYETANTGNNMLDEMKWPPTGVPATNQTFKYMTEEMQQRRQENNQVIMRESNNRKDAVKSQMLAAMTPNKPGVLAFTNSLIKESMTD